MLRADQPSVVQLGHQTVSRRPLEAGAASLGCLASFHGATRQDLDGVLEWDFDLLGSSKDFSWAFSYT